MSLPCKTVSGVVILLVEDDEFVSNMYKRYFTTAGIKVIVAPNGSEGLAVLKKRESTLYNI